MVQKQILTSLLIFLNTLLVTVNSVRILGIFPIPAKSHFAFNEAIMKSLHAAGHQVTMISPFAAPLKVKNYTSIDSKSDDTVIYISHIPANFSSSFSNIMNLTITGEEKYCYDVMKLEVIQEILRSKEKKFDALFIEIMTMFECYLPLAQKLGIPVIGTVTLRSWQLTDIIVENPSNPTVMPNELLGLNYPMSFLQRIKSVWYRLYLQYIYQTEIREAVDRFYNQYFDKTLCYKNEVSLVFYNNHPSLLSRPLIPNAIEVGGLHLQPAKVLPPHLRKFIDEAEHGVILFTLGSIIKASTLDETIKQAFIDAFSVIRQRVIWKFEEEIKNISSNVMLSEWVPQRDILEHKNVKAFISHCGQSGMYEAIHTSTPVVTTPFLFDQRSNAHILQTLGVGVFLDTNTITKDTILQALNTIINDTGYSERMLRLSRVFKDRPLTSQQSVVYWTEYVIRNNGTSHQKVIGSNIPLFQYLLLDIVSVVLISGTLTFYVAYHIFKNVIKFIRAIKNKETKREKKCKSL